MKGGVQKENKRNFDDCLIETKNFLKGRIFNLKKNLLSRYVSPGFNREKFDWKMLLSSEKTQVEEFFIVQDKCFLNIEQCLKITLQFKKKIDKAIDLLNVNKKKF